MRCSASLFFSFLLLFVVVSLGETDSDTDTDSNGLCCVQKTSTEVECPSNDGDGDKEYEREEKASGTQKLIDIGISIFLVLFGGIMSGLTIGLLSLDPVNLEIMKSSEDENARKYANGIAPLVHRHHLLLVTLLMANAVAMESLPLFLDRVVTPLIAIIISVTAVLIFGEIIPQAICTANGPAVGYYLRPLVYIVMLIFFIIAYPISLVLDMIFGKNHTTYYRRAELKELVAIHGEEDVDEKWIGKGDLNKDEITIIKGALDMSKKVVQEAMTPLQKAFMLPLDAVFDAPTLRKVVEAGNSRIPIYHKKREHIVGMVLVKKLIMLRPSEATPIISVDIHRMPFVPLDLPLYDMLNIFQTGKSHMAMVLDPEDHMTMKGIITLEDVIEELIQEEIVDETDVFVDVVKQIKMVRNDTHLFHHGHGHHGHHHSKRKHSIDHVSSPGIPPQGSLQVDDEETYDENSPLLDPKGKEKR
eukprot:CAMPEP_0201522352 /NCGR_PEP_ID=MMETSP0161_2-20130828/17078_1 /ASSEMBLY_ACC=CAM_ASM_000251 /TAXON_ID=180227 /ORGANISM="Neoparamoeba aestuarina, Strain SoJaBio B1-5/56/2" /LENGTH=472 /DNA_ID=CAMNT_0047921171 /DNA_START=53 /DNA_END=1471 /DNA_ORIENTATION=-